MVVADILFGRTSIMLARPKKALEAAMQSEGTAASGGKQQLQGASSHCLIWLLGIQVQQFV